LTITVNGALQVSANESTAGVITVSPGDLVQASLSGGGTDFVLSAISTTGFGNDPLGYYSGCDLYASSANTPFDSSRITVIGNCNISTSVTNSVDSCS
jgi:hypothetical protein